MLSPGGIADELARIAKHPYVAGEPLARVDESQRDAASANESATDRPATTSYRDVLGLLMNHVGVDFTLYKSSTVERRITRRLLVNKLHTVQEYIQFLRGNPKELDALYSDLLISVTSFFRNPEAFQTLEREMVPRLTGDADEEPVRCWVLGCSTGQEAYSMAISPDGVDRAGIVVAQAAGLCDRSERRAAAQGPLCPLLEDRRR